MNSLNQIPESATGIAAVRSMDFVWGVNPFFDPSRQYCDVAPPCPACWEKPDKMFDGGRSSALRFDKITEPMFESKPEGWISEELAGEARDDTIEPPRAVPPAPTGREQPGTRADF